jgi:hypothetical protein
MMLDTYMVIVKQSYVQLLLVLILFFLSFYFFNSDILITLSVDYFSSYSISTSVHTLVRCLGNFYSIVILIIGLILFAVLIGV